MYIHVYVIYIYIQCWCNKVHIAFFFNFKKSSLSNPEFKIWAPLGVSTLLIYYSLKMFRISDILILKFQLWTWHKKKEEEEEEEDDKEIGMKTEWMSSKKEEKKKVINGWKKKTEEGKEESVYYTLLVNVKCRMIIFF